MITLSDISICKFYSKHTYTADSEDALYKDKGSQRKTLTSVNEEKRWRLLCLNPQILGTATKYLITTTT